MQLTAAVSLSGCGVRAVPCLRRKRTASLAPSRASAAPAGWHAMASRRPLVTYAAGFGASAKPSSKGAAKQKKAPTKTVDPDSCACCSGRKQAECCAPYLAGNKLEPNAEAVLRARFTAYTTRDADYIVRSTHHDNPDMHRGSEEQLRKDVEATCKRMQFVRLDVVRVEQAESEEEAFVTFRVSLKTTKRYREGTQTVIERSRFLLQDGRWLYRSTLPLSSNTLQGVK